MRLLPRARLAVPAVLAAVLAGAVLIAAGSSAAAKGAGPASSTFTSHVFATGATLKHTTPSGSQPLSKPDDVAELGGHIFVGFQNGVGPQGEASPTGNLDSTIVEFDRQGHVLHQWDVAGKCDGLTADPALGQVVATVNEDAKSSLYLIKPAGSSPVHYRYAQALPHKGGTDSIDVYNGMLLIVASAPGTTGKAAPQASYPAVYRVLLDAKTHVAKIKGLFSDEAAARVANTKGAGKRVRLALTDPDSTATVPSAAPRFAGDFELTSQGDLQQIFVAGAGTKHQSMSVLKLSVSVDDSVWATTRSGAIYVSAGSTNTIYRVTGPFKPGAEFVAATPCNANNAPSTCPAPGFPANYLGELSPKTGVVSAVKLTGPPVPAQGMLFVP